MYQGNIHYEPRSRRRHTLSRHARKRAQQRGISEACLPIITGFGEREYDGRGGIRYMMTKRAVEKLKRVIGSAQAIDALQGVYAVVNADGKAITLAHRR